MNNNHVTAAIASFCYPVVYTIWIYQLNNCSFRSVAQIPIFKILGLLLCKKNIPDIL